MKKHRFLLGLLSLCLAALLCGCGQQPELPKATVIPSPDAPDAPEEDPILLQARAILAEMTAEQKLGLARFFFARRPA